MPQIKPYQSQVQSPNPIAGPRKQGESIGGGLVNLGQGIGQLEQGVYRAQVQTEISQASLDFAQATAQANKFLEDMKNQTDPNKMDLSDFNQFNSKMDELLKPARDRIRTADGKEFFDKNSLSLKSTIYEKALSMRVEQAGINAKARFDQTYALDSASLRKDPSLYNYILDKTVSSLEGSGMKGVELSKHIVPIKQDLFQQRLRGWMDTGAKGINKAEQILNSNEANILGGDGIDKMKGEVDRAKKALILDAELADRLVKRQEEKQFNEVLSKKYLPKMVDGTATATEILKDPAIPDSKKMEMLDIAKKISDRKLETDAGTYTSLWNRIHLPDGHPNKITDVKEIQKFIGNGLSPSSFNNLEKEITNPDTQEGKANKLLREKLFDTAYASYNKNTAIRDPQGNERFYRFTEFVLQREKEAREKGFPVSELYNSKSKEYLGNSIPSFSAQSINEIFRSMTAQRTGKVSAPPLPGPLPVNKNAVQALTTPATTAPQPQQDIPPPNKGESIKEWKARTGQK